MVSRAGCMLPWNVCDTFHGSRDAFHGTIARAVRSGRAACRRLSHLSILTHIRPTRVGRIWCAAHGQGESRPGGLHDAGGEAGKYFSQNFEALCACIEQSMRSHPLSWWPMH